MNRTHTIVWTGCWNSCHWICLCHHISSAWQYVRLFYILQHHLPEVIYLGDNRVGVWSRIYLILNGRLYPSYNFSTPWKEKWGMARTHVSESGFRPLLTHFFLFWKSLPVTPGDKRNHCSIKPKTHAFKLSNHRHNHRETWHLPL